MCLGSELSCVCDVSISLLHLLVWQHDAMHSPFFCRNGLHIVLASLTTWYHSHHRDDNKTLVFNVSASMACTTAVALQPGWAVLQPQHCAWCVQ